MSKNSCHATSPPAASAAPDTFERVVDYLRSAITDRCNELCLFCMPEGYHGWAQSPDHLTAEEILRLVRADISELVRGMAAIPGVEAIGLSTNGTRLAALANTARGVRALGEPQPRRA